MGLPTLLRYAAVPASLAASMLGAWVMVHPRFHPAIGYGLTAIGLYTACLLVLRVVLRRWRSAASARQSQFPHLEAECAQLERRISEQSENEAALRKIRVDFERAQRQAHVGSWRWPGPGSDILECSTELARIYGIGQERSNRFNEAKFTTAIHPDDRQRTQDLYDRVESSGEPYTIEYRIVRPDGKIRYLVEHAERRPPDPEHANEWIGAVQDVTAIKEAELRFRKAQSELDERVLEKTSDLQEANLALEREIAERKRAEAAWRKHEMLLNSTAEISSLGYALWDELNRTYLFSSEHSAALTGKKPEDYIGMQGTYETDLESTHPDDRERHRKANEDYLTNPRELEIEYRVMHPELGIRHLREILAPVFDEDGRHVQTVVADQDVTELFDTQEQLRQAQKMEAVGQLTGGVAHDFNNLLAVILGSLEIASREERLSPRVAEWAQHAMAAAERGASLTQRLLAFSRKQALRPELLDLNAMIQQMLDLIRHALGDNVAIETFAEANLWSCMADKAQLESSLLNLAINARDAMPEGGTLTIETSNTRIDAASAESIRDILPGEYVLFSVRDTGIGMSQEVIRHAADPFFTTKDVGEGSGLGLSMVQGFVDQSGGHVRIESELHRGTTVELYLPRHAGHEEESSSGAVRRAQSRPRSETVLLVEDDPRLSALIARMLQTLGYDVKSARSAAEALAMLPGSSEIDLLLTDVVLPAGMGGRTLAEKAQLAKPSLPVVFMSGYTADTVVNRSGTAGDSRFLQKPFRMADLARSIEEALETRGRPATRHPDMDQE